MCKRRTGDVREGPRGGWRDQEGGRGTVAVGSEGTTEKEEGSDLCAL